MKKTKILVVLTCLVLCLSLASCTTVVVRIPGDAANAIFGGLFGGIPSGSSDTTDALQPDVPSQMNTEPTTAAPAGEATTAAPAGEATTAAPAGEATTAAPAGEATTAAPADEATTAAPAAPTNGAPTTKEDIIKYYVEAYNKINTDASHIIRNYDNTSQYNNILNVNGNSSLESLANKLMGMFMGPTDEDIEYSINDLPPKNLSAISITPAQIASAECKDDGATYTITLKSTGTDDNYEVDAQPGQNSAGVVGPLLRTEDVTDAAGSFLSFEGLHAYYATCSVVATVDKASGHITHFEFRSPCILHFDKVTALKVVKVENCDIGLLFEQTWTINY